MSIFSKKTKKEVKKEVKVSTGFSFINKDYLKGVILRPRITEKATVLAEKSSVYVFEVDKNATKPLIQKSIISIYNVVPKKITTVSVPAKKVFIRGKVGTKSGMKKAYVYLKKGDKIEFA